jgi:hypothetical protein
MRRPSFFTAVVAAAAATVVIAGMPQPAAAAEETITSNTTLTADHQGSIIIGSNGVTLDCAGHSILGPGFAGVDIANTGLTVSRTEAAHCTRVTFPHAGPARFLPA